jgi:hypothetical protein
MEWHILWDARWGDEYGQEKIAFAFALPLPFAFTFGSPFDFPFRARVGDRLSEDEG